MKFVLNGCDISFYAEAPEDITLKELLRQTDRIEPDYCACGIRSCLPPERDIPTDIFISKNDVWLATDVHVPATIKEK